MASYGINQYLLKIYEKNTAPSFFQTRQISLTISLVWVKKEMYLGPQKLWMDSTSQQEHTREGTWMVDRTLSWRNSEVEQDSPFQRKCSWRTETEVFKMMGSERDMDRDPITPEPSGDLMQDAQKKQEKVALGTTATQWSPWHSRAHATVCIGWDKQIHGN